MVSLAETKIKRKAEFPWMERTTCIASMRQRVYTSRVCQGMRARFRASLVVVLPRKEKIMQARPRTKANRKARYSRCPKCQKQIRLHQVRCRTCHQKLKLK